MKRVKIAVVDGAPILRWCDADPDDPDDWLSEDGRWMRYQASPDERIGEHITRLWNATVSMPAFVKSVPYPKSKQVPLVYREAFVCQPKGFESDWIQILRIVQKIAGDFDLELFIDASNDMRGRAKVIIEAKEKASKLGEKRAKTRYKHIPPPEELKTVFMGRMDFYGGMPQRGDPDRDNFWNAFQVMYQDIWPYDMEKHDELPITVIKTHCNIREWTKEWKDLHGLIKK